MSEPKLISPLLDGFALGASLGEHHGVRCCPAIKENSEEKYIVKIITVPATQSQMDALMLAGAFKEPEDAMEYFKRVCDDIQTEAAFLKELSKLDGFLSYDGWQLEPITKRRLGYELYLVGTYKQSLEKLVRKEPVTHLQAMNLALDLCNALAICRQAGALYVDLKPGNVFITKKNEFRIGDLGFIKLDALRYTALPEKYISHYTPPELRDPMESVNLSADTYALGMILYQLYNEGSLPDLSDTEAPIPAPLNADYELTEIILKAIHPDHTQRWLEPEQMGQAIVSYMQRNVINDTPITPYIPIDPEAQDVQLPADPADEVQEDSILIRVDSAVNAEPAQEAPAQTEVSSEYSHADSDPTSSPSQEPSDPEDTQTLDEPTVEDSSDSKDDSSELTEGTADDLDISEKQENASFASDDLSRIFAKANDLLAHETPAGVVIPEIQEAPDPFAFATEDSIEVADLKTPFDPVMETAEKRPSKKNKHSNVFEDTTKKKKAKRFFRSLLTVFILALLCVCGLWFYQNIYTQTIEQLQVTGDRNNLVVQVTSSAKESLLQITCSDNYGNMQTASVENGKAEFHDLLPDTMYTISAEIDGFHTLIGHTSEVFTTETTTIITAFTAVAGSEDGAVVLNFSVDGDEPEKWSVSYSTEEEKPKTLSFTGHSVSLEGLTLGKVYTFTLDAGDDLSLSGKTSVTYIASKLIMAENLVATTTTGSDMTIRWTAPGDTVVEFWNIRCYNESGYEKIVSVTETEVYLPEIDLSMSYIVEVTAAGMTQPVRTSISANPINITTLNVDDTAPDQLTVQWEYTGTAPKGGWLLMYRIDENANLNVIKCDSPSAVITPKIPEARYHFTIQSVDNTSIFNNVQDYVCPAAADYNANAISKAQITAHMLKTPEDPNWNFDKVGKDKFTDTFVLGDAMSIVLHANADFYIPGANVTVLYVIRDAHGNVIPDYVVEATENWREIWQTGNYHYGELDIPVIPEVAGKYQLKLYIDGKSVAELNFTIQ